MGKTYRGDQKKKMRDKYVDEREKRKRRSIADEKHRESRETEKKRRIYDDGDSLEFFEYGLTD